MRSTSAGTYCVRALGHDRQVDRANPIVVVAQGPDHDADLERGLDRGELRAVSLVAYSELLWRIEPAGTGSSTVPA